MKTEENEAFDDIAKRQGAWGGGFKAKQAMAADKLQEPAQEPVAREWNFCERCGKRTADKTAIHTCTPPQGDA